MVATGPAVASPAHANSSRAPSGRGPGAPAPGASHPSGGASAPAPPAAAGHSGSGPGPQPAAALATPSGPPPDAGSGAVTQAPAPDPAASLARVAHSPDALANVPVIVASNRIATAAAPRSTTAVHKAASVHSAGSSGVTIKNFAFSPGSVSVHVGDTITWTNQDDAPHTATAKDGSFDTGIINKGKSGSHTFTSAGTIAYICSVHPNMHGTVVVAAASASGGTGGGAGSGTPTPSSSSTPSTSGGLPQTGLNLAAVVLVAMLLMGSGTVLRRRVGGRPQKL
jgi:plastocyanin